MSPAEVRTRARQAHAFLDAAALVEEFGPAADINDIGNVVGSLAVLAGIAAGDAITGSVLGERAAGQDHGEAVDLLRSTTPGKSLAAHLSRLIDGKSDSQYAPAMITEARAADLMKAAHRLIDGMDDVLRQG